MLPPQNPAQSSIAQTDLCRWESTRSLCSSLPAAKPESSAHIEASYNHLRNRDTPDLHTECKESEKKSEYDKIQNAVEQVRARGYGVVTPERSEIVLDEPVVIRH